MPTTLRRAATVLLLPVALAACSSNPPPPPSAEGVPVVSSPSAEPTEGPVTAAHRWPNGFSVQITKLERLDPKLASELKSGHVLIRVTATLSNTGTQAVPLNPSMLPWTVLAGPNRYETGQEAGWSDTGDQLRNDLPQQVAPGQSVTKFDTSGVPGDQTGVLAVQVHIADLPSWTFTDAQALLRG